MICPKGVKRFMAAQHAICASCNEYELSPSFPNKCNWDWDQSSEESAEAEG